MNSTSIICYASALLCAMASATANPEMKAASIIAATIFVCTGFIINELKRKEKQ